MKKIGIRHIELDVLKPRQPPLPEFANYIVEFKNVTRVDTSLVEMDERTDSLKVVIDGEGIDFESLKEHISKIGAVVHSVDHVISEVLTGKA